MNNLYRDLPAAEMTELDAIKMLAVKVIGNPSYHKVPTKIQKEWDYKLRWGRLVIYKAIMFEMKDDLESEKSDLFAVEFECYDKPSGIHVTTADYWVFKVRVNGEAGFYMIPTPLIKAMNLNRDYQRITSGGDDNKSRMFLYDNAMLKTHALRIDTADDDSIKTCKWRGNWADVQEFKDSLA